MSTHIIPPPQLPENAPFNDAQRIWLKGFFDGLSAIAPGDGENPEEPTATGPLIHILWGSQTGGAEGLAKKLAKFLEKQACRALVHDMAEVDLAALKPDEPVAIITSTYGDGEPPDNAAALHSTLMEDSASKLDGVPFAVLSLGDSEYPDYCQCGKDFDKRFEELGGNRLFERIDCDVDFDNEFASFSNKLVESVKTANA